MFKFSADHHFVIGRDHVLQAKPCQDHALSFAQDDLAIAVVSDGCSSGGETDMGARMLTFTLINTIKKMRKIADDTPLSKSPAHIRFAQWIMLKEAVGLLGFSAHDALATCTYAYLTPSGGYVHLRGDGVIALRFRDGSSTLLRYDWDNNMPFYPAYADDGPRGYDCFIEAHGGSLLKEVFKEEEWMERPGRVCAKVSETMHSLSAGIQGRVIPFSRDELANMASISVFTDGVTQVDGVDWKDTVIQLLDFKTTEGAFVKRRMNRLLKDYRKRGDEPSDDIACAVVLIDCNDEKGEDYERAETPPENNT
ncbi:MAG: hypothetical protein A2942_00500 [Candidatus Lloydbacteria bacterium RIFCSPLOWO2_01_FULL_50_20]|uniref:PPM-type phosphatase domain-containing protein n=1 Tax=Candidatus Lloydbacteria bacterium RIFCSPLOWO2_01_FULL_50_20 TaxID=1798665 RepID=A0A1G2DCB3_9BACT|nr:MAG: hypothetical protein A3C13_02140 [Candidatus Lloydbacteria bacterium RIFCSPHIGHO2_02_FULL_50_11]OGZ11259.1 MAG: hypothetical protein A2942_00500 [Candidatus Lloydbacteria bacterium RIFCSPLOWO2_01_FULL_50_20]